MQPIKKLLRDFNIDEKDMYLYGEYMAKIEPKLESNSTNKLVLVTAVSPTPAGEGKTTTTIGLIDSLNKLGKKCVGALREPSMGPVFGVKGGANGGGLSQIVPKHEINFHFTGDMHAIGAANNLISACIDNNIYWGNSLNIDPSKIIWRRVLDVNDRSLRDITITINAKKNITYKSGFDITVASEVMAIFCLSNNVEEMKKRIENIIVAYSYDDKPIYVKDLEIGNAIMLILKDAVKPNVVQTLENNLCIVHGGPFANIAHGCNSIMATKTAMNLGEYTVTEAGFGSDLGAEKFLDIVCDNGKLSPSCVVLVVSTRSLKMHGGVDKENLKEENIAALNTGMLNLEQHIKNISAFNIPFLVSITQLDISLPSEIKYLENWLLENKIEYALNDTFSKGSMGGIELGEKVIKLCEEEKRKINPAYIKYENLDDKIEKICKRCYGCRNVIYSQLAAEKMEKYDLFDYYVCMAKTPISLSDDEKNLVITEPFDIHIKDMIIANGASFIVVLTGNIFRMPGLPKIPEANKM